MPLLTADPVTVLPGQREALEQLVRTHSTPQQVVLRARIILHAVEGMEVRKSARELGVWPKIVFSCTSIAASGSTLFFHRYALCWPSTMIAADDRRHRPVARSRNHPLCRKPALAYKF